MKISSTFAIIIILLVITILIGCITTNKQKTKTVEIINYNVTTQWETGCRCDNTYQKFVKTGFYHKVPLWGGPKYNITATIKNSGKNINDIIKINGIFYDINNTQICSTNDLNISLSIHNISKGQSKNFSFEISPEDCALYLNKDISEPQVNNFFHKFESIEFKVKTSK
ncbi:MAG: hypothetical protein V5A68_01540 [Candidatus Thermoplasmatota archaeon]